MLLMTSSMSPTPLIALGRTPNCFNLQQLLNLILFSFFGGRGGGLATMFKFCRDGREICKAISFVKLWQDVNDGTDLCKVK